MEGVITRSQSSRQKDDASKSKGHKSGSKSSVTSSSKRSETSVLKARAAAREAKLQVEMEALRQKELLEREELILRQRREEQERELRQDIEEKQRAVEEQQRVLEKSREEEIRKLQIQSQREEWEIMNRKLILQKELDIKCAAIENDIIDKISERSFSVSGRSKHKASTKFQLEPSTSKLEAPSTSKFEAISLAVSRPLPEQRHPADQPAEQVNFKPTVGFNVRPVATSEDELQASFQSVFPKLSKLPEPRKRQLLRLLSAQRLRCIQHHFSRRFIHNNKSFQVLRR